MIAPTEAPPLLETLAGKRLGFLGNRKLNNSAFLRAIGDEAQRLEPSVTLRFWEKASVYRSVSRQTAAEIVESCDGLISGLGD